MAYSADAIDVITMILVFCQVLDTILEKLTRFWYPKSDDALIGAIKECEDRLSAIQDVIEKLRIKTQLANPPSQTQAASVYGPTQLSNEARGVQSGGSGESWA